MALQNTQNYGLPAIITTNTLIYTGTGTVQGIIVSSHTTGTIKLWDNTTATGTVCVDTYAYATGSQYINLFGAKFTTGLFADTNSTVQKITIVWNPRNG